ncbi:hypothetical protein EYC84_001077 [Monilinia fructicola]|uniref:Uncharacterized protein n=1 Tax=Monilinia fructicola TaxID=38448 RepID=A0A5M9JNS5_MONFR|nr:hypothetical protein EYC84_001077 [Monilinia fructicola]
MWNSPKQEHSTQIKLQVPSRVLGMDIHTLQHKTSHVYIIAPTSIKAGADTENALIQHPTKRNMRNWQMPQKEQHRREARIFPQFTSLMAPTLDVRTTLDECADEHIHRLKRWIPAWDETTMEHMVIREINFPQPGKYEKYGCAPSIAYLVYYGFIEISSRMSPEAELFDDPKYTGPFVESFVGKGDKLAAVTSGCKWPLWNTDMKR